MAFMREYAVMLALTLLVASPLHTRAGRLGDLAHAAVSNSLVESSSDGGVNLPAAQKEADGHTGASGSVQHAGSAELHDPRFWQAFVHSFFMILVSEIGDETFIIAALMAMRHPKVVVFLGAMSALVAMTVISAGLGVIVPNLISRKTTTQLATLLYTIFGVRLLYIAYKSDPKESTEEEIEEVEQKLATGVRPTTRFRRLMSRILTPVFLEAFVLTFLAEWGDRSQIATVTLASHQNAVGVIIGAVIGHAICTGTAVSGGELLAKTISQRTVAVCGGVTFLMFAVFNALFVDV